MTAVLLLAAALTTITLVGCAAVWGYDQCAKRELWWRIRLTAKLAWRPDPYAPGRYSLSHAWQIASAARPRPRA